MLPAPEPLTIVVVLYKTAPAASPTLRSLRAAAGSASATRLIIWDNSPQPAEQPYAAVSLPAERCTYIHTPENVSLARIYNEVADRSEPGGWLLILDQDTELPPDYLEVFRRSRRENPDLKLFAPTIEAGGRYVSPASFAFGWGRYWRRPREGRQPARRTSAIASGLFVARELLASAETRFDERLRLYGIDTAFFIRYARRYPEFAILPVVLRHDLSFDTATVSARARKLCDMLAANAIVYEDAPPLERVLARAVAVLVRVKHAVQHQTFAFLR